MLGCGAGGLPSGAIRATDFYDAVKTDPNNAAERYAGADLMVAGVIKEITGSRRIELATGEPEGSVTCVFQDEQVSVVAQAAKGQNVIVLGRWDGQRRSDQTVMLLNCSFYQLPVAKPGTSD